MKCRYFVLATVLATHASADNNSSMYLRSSTGFPVDREFVDHPMPSLAEFRPTAHVAFGERVNESLSSGHRAS